jgi:iron(III) transport system substrate-binding protein
MGMQSNARYIVGLAAAAIVATTATACGGSDEDDASTAITSAPSAITQDQVDKAEAEGRVVVYADAPQDMWDNLIPTFEDLYPGITVETVDIGGAQLVQRYKSETRTGAESADLIVNFSGTYMQELASDMVSRESTEAAGLPDYANPAPGVYAISADPAIVLYNKLLLHGDDAPTSLQDLVDLPSEYDGMLTSYRVFDEPGYSTQWTLSRETDDGAQQLESLAPRTTFEADGGSMAQKLAQGEYVAAYYVSGVARALLDDLGVDKVLDWVYPADHTIVFPRLSGVMKDAAHPNAAALLQDYLLSVEGQTVACNAGLTAVRADVEKECGTFSITGIEKEIGADALTFVPFDPAMREEQDDFVAAAEAASGR